MLLTQKGLDVECVPVVTEHNDNEINMICEYSSAGRAIPCQGIGHEFEPRYSLQF